MVSKLGIIAAAVAALVTSQTGANATMKRHPLPGNSFIDTSHCTDGSCEVANPAPFSSQLPHFYRSNQKKHKTRPDVNK